MTAVAKPMMRLQRNQTLWVWLAVTVLTSSAAILTRYCRIPATSIGFWRVTACKWWRSRILTGAGCGVSATAWRALFRAGGFR